LREEQWGKGIQKRVSGAPQNELARNQNKDLKRSSQRKYKTGENSNSLCKKRASSEKGGAVRKGVDEEKTNTPYRFYSKNTTNIGEQQTKEKKGWVFWAATKSINEVDETEWGGGVVGRESTAIIALYSSSDRGRAAGSQREQKAGISV